MCVIRVLTRFKKGQATKISGGPILVVNGPTWLWHNTSKTCIQQAGNLIAYESEVREREWSDTQLHRVLAFYCLARIFEGR